MSDVSEMIVVDDDTSPPPLDALSLGAPQPSSSPPTPLPVPDSRSKIAEFISKETRKRCRDKKQLSDADDNDGGTPPAASSSSGNATDDMDEVDTDDLLEEIDLLPPVHNRKTLVSTERVIARLKKTRAKRMKKLRTSQTKAKGKRRYSKPAPPKPRIDDYCYDPAVVEELAKQHPDSYWQFHADREYSMVDVINHDFPLETLNYNLSDQAAITGMTLSPDGAILATFSSVGAIMLWDITNDFQLLRRIRDHSEHEIEELYCGHFTDDQELIVVGGKLKDRFRWSAQDDDNHILPCPIKIFNLETGHRVGQLEGHSEEILCIKTLKFKEKNYYLSTSQDGYIIKWHMGQDWITLVESTRMEDGLTCMAFTVSFVPNTGNKFFMAACDGHLRLYDFEDALLLQTFEDIYSSYCDCGKFVRWLDAPNPSNEIEDGSEALNADKEDMKTDGTDKGDSTLDSIKEETKTDDKGKGGEVLDSNKDMEKDDDIDEASKQDDTMQNGAKGRTVDDARDEERTKRHEGHHAWFISRGAEMCDVSDGVSSIPNTCTLHKLIFPTKKGGKFQLEQVKKYSHEDYHANSWLVKITSNGRYLLAPTIYGQIFVFNMVTGQVTAILKEHQDMEVRDVIFHPYRPLLFSCGDDGVVKVYTFKGST